MLPGTGSEETFWARSDVLNIAHRGSRSIAPENTLAAAREAERAGADMWEFDVRRTDDGRLVVIHDSTLERTTDVEDLFPDRSGYEVDEFTLSEIKRLDAGSWFADADPFGEIARGRVSPEDLQRYRGAEVPTLCEALELSRELGLAANIEIKPIEDPAIIVAKRTGEVAKETVRLVEEYGMEDDVLVSSFDHAAVREALELCPGIRGAVLADEPVSHPVALMKRNNVKALNVSGSVLKTEDGKRMVDRVRKAGSDYRIYVWTVNDPADLRRLLEFEVVRGIMTDYPERLARILAEREG